MSVLQPGEMVRRIAREIESHLVELGSDGRLIHLQTEELCAGMDASLGLVLRDYTDERGVMHLQSLSAENLMDLRKVVAVLEPVGTGDKMYAELAPRGYRLLHRLPQQLSEGMIVRIVDRFGTLPEILGVGGRARVGRRYWERHGPAHPRRSGPTGRGQHL